MYTYIYVSVYVCTCTPIMDTDSGLQLRRLLGFVLFDQYFMNWALYRAQRAQFVKCMDGQRLTVQH